MVEIYSASVTLAIALALLAALLEYAGVRGKAGKGLDYMLAGGVLVLTAAALGMIPASLGVANVLVYVIDLVNLVAAILIIVGSVQGTINYIKSK